MEEIHERLLHMIAGGELPPQTHLYQERLADEMGVSRTPIREALLRLEREGIVYSQPGDGIYVKGISDHEVTELYEVREILEPFAARTACERASPKDLADVQAIQARHEGRYPQAVPAAFRSNLELHTRLARACGNHVLLRFLHNVWHQDTVFRIFSFYSHDPLAVEHMIWEHRQIVDAYLERDAVAVEELLRRHIHDGYKALLQRMDEFRAEKESG